MQYDTSRTGSFFFWVRQMGFWLPTAHLLGSAHSISSATHACAPCNRQDRPAIYEMLVYQKELRVTELDEESKLR